MVDLHWRKAPPAHPATPSSRPPLTASETTSEQQNGMPRYTVDENGGIVYQYDPEYIARKYEVFPLQVWTMGMSVVEGGRVRGYGGGVGFGCW